MTAVVALTMPPGPEFVQAVTDIWEAGKAVFPIDRRLPRPERSRLLATVRPTHIFNLSGRTALAEGQPGEVGDALVIATSGTTGTPKGVVLTMDAVRSAVEMTDGYLETDPAADRWLLALPPAHIGGFSVVARSVLRGTPITALPRFDAPSVDAAEATLTALVPAVLSRIDPSRFRQILLGGSSLPVARPANTVATYGLTETCGGIVYEGRPLPGVEIRVVDNEVHLSSPTLLREYRHATGRTSPILPDGWLPTGDLGTFVDGVLSIEGRKDDVIITGGEKVWPQRVEAALGGLDSIADVAVVGRADLRWGSAVTAIVVPTDQSAPPSLADLRAVAKASLPAYMAPHGIEYADAIPRTVLGKIRRGEL